MRVSVRGRIAVLILLAVGLREPLWAQAVRIYSGSVTNDGFKSFPATLSIRLVEAGGDRLTGYLGIGAPLGGSGQFAGRRIGDSLYIVTSSATGDTIAWSSTSAGQFIGGTYRILGGPFRAQTGTWSARMYVGFATADNPSRVPVEVVDASEGNVGRSLIFLIREEFRRSAAFRLTENREPRFRVIVGAMPRSSDTPDASTIYSVVWTFESGSEPLGWRNLYLDQTYGYSGVDVLSRSATSIIARTDQIVNSLLQGFTDALR